MSKREYHGPPIDLTGLEGETHLSERNGETVAGTSEDDYHDENTESWPSALDKDDFSETEQRAIELLCLQPTAPYSAVAEKIGCSDTVVYNARQKIADQELADEVPFDVKRENEPGTDHTDTTPDTNLSARDWFIEAMSDDPSATPAEIMERTPDGTEWSKQNYYNVMRQGRGLKELKRKIIAKGTLEQAAGTIQDKIEGVDVEPVEPEPETDTGEEPSQEEDSRERVVELEQAVAELTRRLVTERAGSDIAAEIVANVSDDVLADSAIGVVVNE